MPEKSLNMKDMWSMICIIFSVCITVHAYTVQHSVSKHHYTLPQNHNQSWFWGTSHCAKENKYYKLHKILIKPGNFLKIKHRLLTLKRPAMWPDANST